MANVKNTEVKAAQEESAPKKRGRPPAPKKQPSLTFENISNVDLPIPGKTLKSGTKVTYPAHIGKAMESSSVMQNYIRLNQIKVL